MKRTIIIIGSIVALLAILIFTFFEIKDVPDVEAGASYDIEKKDAGGLFVFYKMVQSLYGEAQTNLVKSDDFKFCVEFPIKMKLSKMKYTSISSYEKKRLAGKKKVNALKDGFLILSEMLKLFFRYKVIRNKKI